MLVIQDPTNEQSTYLLESLLDAFQSAHRVAGAFAFASSRGVRLFTEDDAFRDVARNHSVDLVIGIDAITNTRALDSLDAVATEFPNVRIRAFMNPRPEALFHPKFCWTKKDHGGHLITGSGNLTEGGLLGHWEAYSVERLNAAEIAAVETTWNHWTAKFASSLLPLDDPNVRRLANENNILVREGDLPTLVAPSTAVPLGEEPITAQLMPKNALVLVAEIPQSGDRWKQVNFHLDDYETFFGAKENRLVVFRHVNSDGSMAEYERSRPPVTVKSRNFRFELAAARGISYPDPKLGRPIGVYIRVATRTFFYRLVLPADPEYRFVKSMLRKRTGPPAGKMRSARLTVADLRREWPSAPFWSLPTTA